MNDNAPIKDYPALGLIDKYHITHADGTPVDPNAIYFVLRLDTDPHARVAMKRYATGVLAENPMLAHDLRSLIAKLEAGETPAGEEVKAVQSELLSEQAVRQTMAKVEGILEQMRGARAVEDKAALADPRRINVYICEVCHKPIVTKDVDEGVTPMFLSCKVTPGCPGKMVSGMYRVPQGLLPDYEWYKPSSLEGLEPSTREHVERGGLLLRPVGAATGPWEHSR